MGNLLAHRECVVKKIGVITDCHGNLYALKAITELFFRQGVEEIFHTGDVVDIGFQSKQCLDFLWGLPNCTMILGNHDYDYLIDRRQHLPMSHVSAEHKSFVFDSIGEDHRRNVERFPVAVVRSWYGKTFVFTHYASAQHNFSAEGWIFDKIDSHPTAESFDRMFQYGADGVFFGHKHESCDIVGKSTYVDVDSIACHPDAVAKGIVLTVTPDGWNYQRVSAPYDREKYVYEMLKSGLPDAQYMLDFYYDHIYGTDGTKEGGNL